MGCFILWIGMKCGREYKVVKCRISRGEGEVIVLRVVRDRE